jgi:hypothetical protein
MLNCLIAEKIKPRRFTLAGFEITKDGLENIALEACGWEQIPRYLIRDRDGAYVIA